MVEDPGGPERICRRCGTRYETEGSVCPSCGTPSAPKMRGVSTGTNRRERTLDWTAVLLAVLTALVVLTLALWVQPFP